MPDIAVVSMAGVFPGARDIQTFMGNILDKKDAIGPVDPARWAARPQTMVHPEFKPDMALSDRAGLIRDFQFDPHGFRVDQEILAQLDPVHHLVLSAGRKAFETCYTDPDLKRQTGVILAAIALPTETASVLSRDILTQGQVAHLSSIDSLRASVVSSPGAILARAMGFCRGSFTLDAACASSLFAVKLACEQLIRKKADIMVAGGVSRPDSLYTQVGFSQLKALSPTGHCAPFDRNANGLVVGEGCGIIVLKRLADALACGDNILGVIRGYGVSNDIQGNLVGPASEGQVRAMAMAYDMAGWTPGQIQYMECHGTGTPLGDKVETQSICTLLKACGCPDTALSMGSVKSMIGHLLTAAGAASFAKTLMAMNQKTLPPSLNFEQFPDDSPLAQTRVRVQTRPEEWAPANGSTTRKAGISAFGFGGINAHILVEEWPKNNPSHFVVAQTDQAPPKSLDIAIVGMGIQTRDCQSPVDFSGLMAGRTAPKPSRPGNRWQRRTGLPLDEKSVRGFFMENFQVGTGEFHIPPVQMEEILPQHLILLKAAKSALVDAGIPPRPEKGETPRTQLGCAIGIDFDFNAANFFLRWSLKDRNLGQDFLDRLSPPLNFNRTLGALGGIVASRVAREFMFGGPCFTLSAGSASAMKAVEIGIHSLTSGETDLFVCGCVDMAGDLRQFLVNHAQVPFDGVCPSEGAGAIVLKPLDQALKDRDRIYSVIKGVGNGGGGQIPGEPVSDPAMDAQMFQQGFKELLNRLHTDPEEIFLLETQTLGTGTRGRAESLALDQLSDKGLGSQTPVILGSALPLIGDTRTVSGLFSLIKASLCLSEKQIPCLDLPQSSGFNDLDPTKFSIPVAPVRWKWNPDCPKKAVVAAMTGDGGSAQILLEEVQPSEFPPGKISRTGPGISGENLCIPTCGLPIDREILETLGGPTHPAGLDPNVMPSVGPDRGQPDPDPLNPDLFCRTTEITARAHEKFLTFSQNNMTQMETQFAALAGHAGQVIQLDHPKGSDPAHMEQPPEPAMPGPRPFLDRDQCLQFALGKTGRILGPDFDIVDTYPARVRLPAEPLMLVDRIMAIEGEPLSLGRGKIITQHDVQTGAWYLDGNKAPVSISIEAGQADLFLCHYLGIDHRVKGKRKYRLLDARVTFHRSLPNPGETIEYHIEIDRFLKQGEVYLFFFHYKGYINQDLFISMREGCAGFFTDREVENSGGIILKKEELAATRPKEPFTPLVPVQQDSFSDKAMDRLRQGDLEGAFGAVFKKIFLGRNQCLPDRPMHLIDRVLDFNPWGGRFGLGSITAELDIHPDDWFLVCHFIDDRVMPGTLMYECCAHTLRVFVQRMGWVSQDAAVHYDVLPHNESDLKCRGPVTPLTRKARYEIEIKEMGYNPEPYVIADAHMFSDDHRIVLYKDMGMRLAGTTRQDLENFWRTT